MHEQSVTCQVRYTLNMQALDAFEEYARTWIRLIERYGGVHHGYFVPRAHPDGLGPSFAGLGYDGPGDIALALFTFPSEAAYRAYRLAVAEDPECAARTALVGETQCFTAYERLFLRSVSPEDAAQGG